MDVKGVEFVRREVSVLEDGEECSVSASAACDGGSFEGEGRAALVVVVGGDGTRAAVIGSPSAIDLAEMDDKAGNAALQAALDLGMAAEFMAARIILSGVLKGGGHEGD